MASNSCNTLLISSEFPPNVGGIGNHAYNLASALAAENYDVTVVADIIDKHKKELHNFAAQQPFAIKWVPRRRAAFLSYLQRIVTSLRCAAKADKVICSGKFSLWQAIIIRLLHPGKDLIAVVHGSELDIKSRIAKSLTAFALTRFNKIIAVSNYTRSYLPANLPGSIKTFVIHNGINNSEFVNDEASIPLQGSPALITVGSVSERKGQENVINALPAIKALLPSVFYHVVGKPVLQEKLEKLADELKVTHQLKFYGAIERKQLLQTLSGATVKLMLSNHTVDGDFEGFGIAVLEANAFGIPVIGTRNSGIADAIQHCSTGILVNPTNQNEIAEAVQKILANYSWYSSNAKKWAKQHDWKFIVKEYIEVLNYE
jgi:phosphatidyl-myo-inositol dimannoside synthase